MAPKWQRELVQDHKFDFVDIEELKGEDTFWRRVKYGGVFVLALRSFMLYVADLASVAFQFIASSGANSGTTTGSILQRGDPTIIQYFKYVYLFCLLMSILLLLVDARKARRIIRSRDISFTFTNDMAYRYYALKSYAYFQFFEEINHMRRFKDNLALFVFLRLRGWKRLMFAEAPRAAINVYFLYSANVAIQKLLEGQSNQLNGQAENTFNFVLLLLIAMSVLIFAFSFMSHLVAILVYVPLVFEIRGNLKEFCCFKIDKRIAQLIARGRELKAMEA